MIKLTDSKEANIEKAGLVCFYLGLLLEILIVILDKSSWINPAEGQLFRITFLLFALKVCMTKYSVREWAAILAAGAIAAACYFGSSRDEAVRVVVFVVSMKGVNHKRAMKVVFWGTVAGMLALAGLAFAGILGEVYDVTAGYGFKEGTVRLCLGVGNANALACMIWALMTLGIYLYHERMKLWHYVLLLLLTGGTYLATVTRTALLVMAATVLLAFIMQYGKKIRTAKWVYFGGIAGILGCVAFSVFAALVSRRPWELPEWIAKLDRILTGRIASICVFSNDGGILRNWRLFGDPTYIEYFDMGYVRLFFWYGIVPGLCAVLMLCLLIWQCRQQQDYMGFVLTVSFGIYTVIEAHAVSVYIARNYVLLLMGAYWPYMLWMGRKGGQDKEAYWWRFWTLYGAKHRL